MSFQCGVKIKQKHGLLYVEYQINHQDEIQTLHTKILSHLSLPFEAQLQVINETTVSQYFNSQYAFQTENKENT